MTDATLAGADLEKAELGRAVFLNADLTDVDLRGAYLARADLRGALLAGADLTGAEFYLADLRGADLSQATGLDQPQLVKTCGDDTTKLPAGIGPGPDWPCASRGEETEEDAE
jgi:uncharacterized protein YjbI with pentapeptide repeats